MRNKLLLLLGLIPGLAYSQQDSRITIDSGNKNNVSVKQQGKDSLQKSNIGITKSDSNTVELIQTQQDSTKNEKKEPSYMHSVSNTKEIIGLILAIIALVTALWKGVPYIKKIMSKK